MGIVTHYSTNVALNPTDSAIPCGLPAKYLFRDEFRLLDSTSTQIVIDSSDIALSVDKNSRFGNTDDDSKQWANLEDQHLMVWFQVEAFYNFDKLYGEISTTLNKGTNYTIEIQNLSDLTDFDVEKYVVFSTTSFLGGDYVLGWIFLLAFIYLTGLIVVMLIMEILKVKQKGPFKKAVNPYKGNEEEK